MGDLKTSKHYDRLCELHKDYPELTFENEGYQYLGQEIEDRHKEQLEEIDTILTEVIDGFKKFNNFKSCANGSFNIRCQHSWDSSFIGVGYFNIELFKEDDEPGEE
jgi:hypothetical protein